MKFVWDSKCNKAFNDSKNALLETDLLEFYDPNKPIVVVSDASGYGLGGVIAHIVDGIEKPVNFTSFSLDKCQKSYPILHLEALALVCTIKKFHKYLYGKKFLVFTDHKPLVGIFGKEGKNSIFVTRIQRYVLDLSIYDFEIRYRPSAKMGNADFCSRFPLPQLIPNEIHTDFVRSINFSKNIPLDYVKVANATKNDEFLLKVISYMKNGWPDRIDKHFFNVFANHHDIEIIDDCLLYQDRVVIPKELQKPVLNLLHGNHSGIVKMKRLARQSVYWFGINSQIEEFVKECEVCNSMAVVSKRKVESEWIPTTRPFSRIHVDFFHFSSHTFLLIVDSYSKWVEIEWMKTGTECGKVLKKLVAFFARFGLPDVLVSDGGPPFNSFAFVCFLENQGIKVFKSPPYHPASNGQAERFVRTVKDVLKKFLLEPEFLNLELEDQINLFLINYRNNSISADGHFPSEKVFAYIPKTLIDLLNPKKHFKKLLLKPAKTFNDDNQLEVVSKLKRKDPLDDLMEGDAIWYQNHKPGHLAKWVKAIYLKQISQNLFQVLIGSVVVTAHRAQIRTTGVTRGEIRPNVVVSKQKSMNVDERPRDQVSDPVDFEMNECNSDKYHQKEENSSKKRKKTCRLGGRPTSAFEKRKKSKKR